MKLKLSCFGVLLLIACGADAEEQELVEEVVAPVEAPKITTLKQVDLTGLNGAAKKVWVKEINDLLSPCGEPISLARCVAEEKSCKRCVPGARYLARMAKEGVPRDEMRDLFRLRYGRDTEILVDTKGSAIKGSEMATLQIVEFSDFECPHCRSMAPILDRLVKESKGKVQVVFKNYPLGFHEHAKDAAAAAVAAGRQGKFWEMHDLLFENQTTLSPSSYKEFATKLELDIEAFEKARKSDEVKNEVERDKNQGRKAGVESTPTIIVGGRMFMEPPENLPMYVAEALEE